VLKKEQTASNKLQLGFKCGECLHHEKYSKFEKPCIALGVTKQASAPSCFTPNVFRLQKHTPDILNQLGFLLKDFSSADARILLGLLRSKQTYEKYKLMFGQPVYVRLGQDYLSNYYLGYVIGVAGHGNPMVYVTSDMHRTQIANPAIMALLPDSVFSTVTFKKKRAQLKQNNLLVDPKPLFNKRQASKAKADTYEVPTLESVPASWFENFSDRTRATAIKGKTATTKRPIKRELDGSLSFSVRHK
jgi:hypothetical protein